MSEQIIADDEVLFRRIPCSERWFEPPDRITSANFKLSKARGDLGLSVYRARKVSAESVLAAVGDEAGSFILAEATAGEIRALRDGNGKPLHLDVVAVGDENDPGHAEIRGPTLGVMSNSAALALKKLFRGR